MAQQVVARYADGALELDAGGLHRKVPVRLPNSPSGIGALTFLRAGEHGTVDVAKRTRVGWAKRGEAWIDVGDAGLDLTLSGEREVVLVLAHEARVVGQAL